MNCDYEIFCSTVIEKQAFIKGKLEDIALRTANRLAIRTLEYYLKKEEMKIDKKKRV